VEPSPDRAGGLYGSNIWLLAGGIVVRDLVERKVTPRPGEKLQRWTCPRCKREYRFWGRKPVPTYCPNCGLEPGREGDKKEAVTE